MKEEKVNSPIEFINNTKLDNEVKELFNEYYKLYTKIEKDNILINKYKIKDEVILKKGTLIHGIKSYCKEKIENIKKYGIILAEYRGVKVAQQKYCTCFWIMNNDIKLSNYINYYSGDTIFLKERFKNKYSNVYIPCNPYDGRNEIFKKINKLKYKIYYVHESKENRFMPSLSYWEKGQDDYIAFILNNKYTDRIMEYDIYQGNIKLDIIKKFIPSWAVENTIINKLPTQTDHELSIIFGLPSNLIEGILVGRLLEKNVPILEEIKSIFQNCYICNLDGKVIVE